MVRIILKHIPKRPLNHSKSETSSQLPKNNGNKNSDDKKVEEKKNKKNKKNGDMINEEQISAAEAQANNLSAVKVVKKDRGLIERTESSKIILTEDNRQVLND